MLPDWVSNLGPLTYESGALPIAQRGPQNMGDLGQRSKDDTDLTNSCTHLDKCIYQFL